MMRISKNDSLWSLLKKSSVALDGVIMRVTEADEEKKEIVCYVRDNNDKIIMGPDTKPLKEKKYGNVEIILSDNILDAYINGSTALRDAGIEDRHYKIAFKYRNKIQP